MIKIFLIGLLLFSTSVFASTGEGGGDAVKRADKWELLDLAEHKSIGLKYFDPLVRMGKPYGFYNSYVKSLLKVTVNKCGDSFRNLFIHFGWGSEEFNYKSSMGFDGPYPINWEDRNFKSPIGTWYFTSLSVWTSTKWYFTDQPLSELSDEGDIRITKWDDKIQVAIQKGDQVIIYKPIFDKMDDLNQAALLMHELVLRLAMVGNPEYIQKNGTKSVREFVGLISDPEGLNMPPSEFKKYCGEGKLFTKNLVSVSETDWSFIDFYNVATVYKRVTTAVEEAQSQ